MLPCWVRNPASGRITSLGMGGKTVSRSVSKPTPHSPRASITCAAIPTIPPSSSAAAVALRKLIRSISSLKRLSYRRPAAHPAGSKEKPSDGGGPLASTSTLFLSTASGNKQCQELFRPVSERPRSRAQQPDKRSSQRTREARHQCPTASERPRRLVHSGGSDTVESGGRRWAAMTSWLSKPTTAMSSGMERPFSRRPS